MQVTKMQVLTDIQLRAGWFKNRQDTWCVPEGTMLTPAAKDFIKEHGITITYGNAAGVLAARSWNTPPRRGRRK